MGESKIGERREGEGRVLRRGETRERRRGEAGGRERRRGKVDRRDEGKEKGRDGEMRQVREIRTKGRRREEKEKDYDVVQTFFLSSSPPTERKRERDLANPNPWAEFAL